MGEQRVDALLLTTEPEVRYFTGFLSQFWESPTRPWFLVIPSAGKPVAVIPEIGESGMAQTWIDDIQTWPAPRPEDDGISTLVSVFEKLTRRFGKIGMSLGVQSVIRMPVHDYESLSARFPLGI